MASKMIQQLLSYIAQSLDGEGEGESKQILNVYLTVLVAHLVTQASTYPDFPVAQVLNTILSMIG